MIYTDLGNTYKMNSKCFQDTFSIGDESIHYMGTFVYVFQSTP